MVYTMNREAEFTLDTLQKFINKHKADAKKLHEKMKLYEGKHAILEQPAKEAYKPDNRLVVNFAKYIVDTLNGYFIGIPVKTTHDTEAQNGYIEMVEKYNDTDDSNAELSKLCSVYGYAYELLFIDEAAQVGLTYVTPEEAFIVYDKSIRRKALYGVRYYIDEDKKIIGSYSDAENIYYFKESDKGGLIITGQDPHYFGEVPLIEYVENEERQGAFDNVRTLIEEYNKAISEKANDVDYYADAYLLVLGALLDEDTLRTLRDSRIINMAAGELDNIKIEFLTKPESDATQEHLIDRLEKLIFHISMVANINDENFGSSSGISLKYKLQSMSNLAAVKERKFAAGMTKRWKLISNVPNSKLSGVDWLGISYKFTRNVPANLLEETEIARNLQGITSEETQLKSLSIVDNVKTEIARKQKEQEDSVDMSSNAIAAREVANE